MNMVAHDRPVSHGPRSERLPGLTVRQGDLGDRVREWRDEASSKNGELGQHILLEQITSTDKIIDVVLTGVDGRVENCVPIENDDEGCYVRVRDS